MWHGLPTPAARAPPEGPGNSRDSVYDSHSDKSVVSLAWSTGCVYAELVPQSLCAQTGRQRVGRVVRGAEKVACGGVRGPPQRGQVPCRSVHRTASFP